MTIWSVTLLLKKVLHSGWQNYFVVNHLSVFVTIGVMGEQHRCLTEPSSSMWRGVKHCETPTVTKTQTRASPCMISLQWQNCSLSREPCKLGIIMWRRRKTQWEKGWKVKKRDATCVSGTALHSGFSNQYSHHVIFQKRLQWNWSGLWLSSTCFIVNTSCRMFED